MISIGYRVRCTVAATLWQVGHQGVVVIPLGTETVTPLYAPEVSERIRSARSLLSETLILSEVKKVRWTEWFAANDLVAPESYGLRFDRSFLSLSAAADGAGVALESTRLAERELAADRLVPLACVPACQAILAVKRYIYNMASEGAGLGD